MQGAQQQTLIGATIGNYRIISQLGEGGMGAVYLAEHPHIGKKVAVKVLHDEYSANQDVVTRFFNEARAVNDIGHPNIVDIIDYGVVQPAQGSQFVYFIMEFLGGISLAQLCAEQSPVPPERALHICAQVADALAASHAKGIIHRDLKPDNIYLIPRGREQDFVKVLDFGIAKLTGDAPGSRKTRTGIVMGTPAYMSPEQCEGKGNIDHRTDIYALGIVLYEMITGRVPFLGEGYGEVLVQHLTTRPVRPSTIRGAVPPHVEAVVMKALEKKREDRFQSMEQLIAAMRDPEGYVEQNGGLAAFVPTDAHANGAATIQSMSRPPSQVPAQRPTTLGAGAGEMVDDAPRARSKKPLVFGAIGLAVVLGVVAVVVFGGNKDGAAPTTPVAAVTPDPQPEKKPDPVPEKQPEVKPVDPVPVPAAAKVVISVSSTPPGADIYVGAEATPRGQTPMDLELAKGENQVLTLKLAGFKEKQKAVKTDRDSNVDFELKKDRSGHRPRDGKKPVDKDGVLSPF